MSVKRFRREPDACLIRATSPFDDSAALIRAAHYQSPAPISTRRRAADHVDNRLNGVGQLTIHHGLQHQ